MGKRKAGAAERIKATKMSCFLHHLVCGKLCLKKQDVACFHLKMAVHIFSVRRKGAFHLPVEWVSLCFFGQQSIGESCYGPVGPLRRLAASTSPEATLRGPVGDD